ncbi:MAG: hypothetical protein CR966_00720 [Pseudomonadales bacterium]|nr:MAG: hypothetical protein CR966_00720 [Pseudomonadales bacterium]
MSIDNIKFYSITDAMVNRTTIATKWESLTSKSITSGAVKPRPVWVAVSDYYLPVNECSIYTVQSHSVRLLLQALLDYLQIEDRLVESKFPYHLATTGYFVCFSHTDDKCALVMSPHNAGIDIEVREVTWQVVKRFFHKNELDLLEFLEFEQRQWICKQLWKIKECLIKINQSTLTVGMGVDLSFLIAELINDFVSSFDKRTDESGFYSSSDKSNCDKKMANISIDLKKYKKLINSILKDGTLRNSALNNSTLNNSNLNHKICHYKTFNLNKIDINKIFIDNLNQLVVVY